MYQHWPRAKVPREPLVGTKAGKRSGEGVIAVK